MASGTAGGLAGVKVEAVTSVFAAMAARAASIVRNRMLANMKRDCCEAE
jgi:hypothetical protein